MSTAFARVTALARDVLRVLRSHDVMLYAAGLTFYAAIAAVPLVLVALYAVSLLLGASTVQSLGRQLADAAPESLGFADQLRQLTDVGPELGLASLVAALLAGTTYGEGLLRAIDRMSGAADRPAKALLGRLLSLAPLAALPLVVLAGLGATAAIIRWLGEGTGSVLLGAYLAFLVGWASSTLLLALIYRTFAPERPDLRAVLWGAAAAGSFLTGMTEAWVLLLSLDVDISRAYGGATGIAAAAAFAVWLFLVQYVVLVGLVLTRRLAGPGQSGDRAPKPRDPTCASCSAADTATGSTSGSPASTW